MTLRNFVILKKSLLRLFFIITAVVVGWSSSNQISAMSAAQQKLFDGGILYTNAEADCDPSATPAATPGSIYVLGDSVIDWFANASDDKAATYGVEPRMLDKKLREKSWNPTIQAKGGRQLRGSHYGVQPDGLTQIEQDTTAISSANTVIVALGTNRNDPWGDNTKEGFRADVKQTLTRIREMNKNKDNLKIFWVNFAFVGDELSADPAGTYPYTTSFNDYNSVLEEESELGVVDTESTTGTFDIIDWKQAVADNPSYIGTDYGDLDGYAHVHPSAEGTAAYVELLTNAVGDGAITGAGVAGSAGLPNNMPSGWKNLIAQAAPKYPDVDPRVVAAVVYIENNSWPVYKETGWPESSASARGPFQFIPETWFGKDLGPGPDTWMDPRNEANYAPNGMGTDGDGDGIRDPNNPKDAVEAAFKHHKGSGGKPVATTGYTGSTFEADYETTIFDNNDSNLLYYIRKYNGSGASGGGLIKNFLGGGQNEEYVLAGFVLLASNFTKSYDYPVNALGEIRFADEADKGGPGSSAISTGSSSGGCGGAQSIASTTSGNPIVGGYTLPLDKKWYDENKNWFTKPHHDYPASDIPVPTGTNVYSMTAGTIIKAPNEGGYGEGVTIDAGGGIVFTYGHGSDGGSVEGAKQGDTVAPGQLIMHSASTGQSTGPHLHLELDIDGQEHCPQTLFVGIVEGTVPDVKSLPTSGCSN